MRPCSALDIHCIELGPISPFNHLINNWQLAIGNELNKYNNNVQMFIKKHSVFFQVNLRRILKQWKTLEIHYAKITATKKNSGDKSMSCFMPLKQMSAIVAPLNYWQQTRINGLLNVPFFFSFCAFVCSCMLVYLF